MLDSDPIGRGLQTLLQKQNKTVAERNLITIQQQYRLIAGEISIYFSHFLSTLFIPQTKKHLIPYLCKLVSRLFNICNAFMLWYFLGFNVQQFNE